MTAEQLHDAIGLLPGDLLEETDRLRQAPRPSKIVLWKPVLAMAACLALILTGWFWWFQPKGSAGGTADMASLQAAPAAGAPENGAAAEAPVREEEAAPFRSGSTLTDGAGFPDWVSTPRLAGQAGEPAAVLLTSPADWQDYRTQMGEAFDLTELDAWLSGLEESWFESWDLALIRVENVSEEENPPVVSVTRETGNLTVTLSGYDDSGEGVCRHLLLAVEKGSLRDSGEIRLILE